MTIEPSLTTHSWRHTKLFLLAFYVLAVLWGITNALAPEPARATFILSWGVAVSMGWWAIVDAKLRERPIPTSARAWFVLLAWIIVPIYIIWSRRWRGVGWVVVNGACWYLLTAIAMNVVGFSVFGENWAR